MIEDELIKIWKSSPRQEQVKFDKSRFMLDVQSSVDDFYKQMKTLFIRESMGAFIAIPMFIIYSFQAPHILTKIGFFLVAVGAGYILYITKKSKLKVPDQFNLNYVDYLHKTKVYLEDSMRKRKAVVFWYLAPIVLPLWMAVLGEYLDNPDALNYMIITIGVSILASIGIYFMNRRSAQKFVAPKLEKVNSLIQELKE